MTIFEYTKSPVSTDRLVEEVRNSNISIALDNISLMGDDQLTITFKADLSETEEISLNTIVENHSGEPLSQNVITEVKIVEDAATPKDSDGSPLSRIKITTTGWHYQLHGVEFETSKLNCLVSKKVDNTNYGFSIMKFYKLVEGAEVEITGGDLNQEFLDTNCIKTIMDWEPNHDVELIGGFLKQKNIPTEDLTMWVVGVPDVPENYGGSKPFVVNVNLAYIGLEEGIRVDGRAPKYLTYSASYHTSKIRMIFRHSAGYNHKMHMVFELFRA